jgi:predicted PurR-regulated permease PerM
MMTPNERWEMFEAPWSDAEERYGMPGGLHGFSSIAGPVFLALILTIAVSPLRRYLIRRGVRTWIAAVIALVVVIALLLGLAAALALSIARLATLLPTYQDTFGQLINDVRGWLAHRGIGNQEIPRVVQLRPRYNVVPGRLDRLRPDRRRGGCRRSLPAERPATVAVGPARLNFVFQSIIQPKIVGDAVGMSTTLTFLSQVFWGWVLGPLGAILAIPLSLLAKALLLDADPSTHWVNDLISGTDDQPAEVSPPPEPEDV